MLSHIFLENNKLISTEWLILYYINILDTAITSHCFPQVILNSIIDSNESNYDIKFKYQTSFFSLDDQYPEDTNSSLKTKKLDYTWLFLYENVEN